MGNRPLLSICIPTYNREKYLKECLNSIFSQKVYNADDIEIVISNNNSSDNTHDFIIDLQKNHQNIIYNTNSKNLGFDRNLDKVLNMANGIYCRTLSDDEIIVPGGLTIIIDTIKYKTDIAYININAKLLNNNILEELPNGEELIKKYGLVPGLISKNIFNKDLIKYIQTDQFYGNYRIHLSLAFTICANKRVILIGETIISSQQDQCKRAKGGTVLFTFTSLKNIISGLKYIGYKNKVIDPIVNSMLKDLPKTVISAKIQGLPYTRQNFSFIFNEYKQYPFFCTIALIIYTIPNSIFQLFNTFR